MHAPGLFLNRFLEQYLRETLKMPIRRLWPNRYRIVTDGPLGAHAPLHPIASLWIVAGGGH
jgi:hypothetical protein